MSSLTLVKSALASRTIRKALGGEKEKSGIRLIDLRSQIKVKEGDEEKNILQKVWDFFSGAGGWIMGALKGIVKKVSSLGGGLWAMGTQAVYQMFFFDWNQSDEQIDKQIKAAWEAAAATLGEAVGFVLGGGVNIGASTLIPKIGPAVAAYALGEFTEEAWGEFKGAFRTVMNTAARTAGLTAFKWARFSIKAIGEQLPLPESWKKSLRSWGDGKKPFIIYKAVEEYIENNFNGMLEKFLGGAWEGFFEGWMETGMIVAGAIDATLAAMKAQKDQGGTPRTLEIDLYPKEDKAGSEGSGDQDDKGGKPEQGKVLLNAPQPLLKQMVYSTLAQHQILGDRSVGLLVGQPAEEFVAARLLTRQLTLVFRRGASKPPWKDGTKTAGTTTVTIPNPKVGLSWNNIKSACSKWTWGEFEASCLLSSGRILKVRGSSPDEARDKAKQLLALSSDEYHAINVTQEMERHPELKKRPQIAYPARGTLLVRRASTTLEGRTDLKGNRWTETPIHFDLWPDSEPPGLEPFP